MKESFKMQFREMLSKKTTVLAYLIILLFVCANFLGNVFSNREIQYITQMYDLVKKLTWSSWSVSGQYFMQLFPLLAILPSATAWITEKNSGIHAYIRSRTGERAYWHGKICAAFSVSFLVFVIPFLMELILSVCCFSMKSKGDPSGFDYLTTVEEGKKYVFSQLFYGNRILYAFIFILMISGTAGVFAMFNLFVTTLPGFRYKIFAFFPVYIVLFLMTTAETWISPGKSLYYGFALMMFETTEVNYPVLLFSLILLVCMTFLLAERKIRKGEMG